MLTSFLVDFYPWAPGEMGQALLVAYKRILSVEQTTDGLVRYPVQSGKSIYSVSGSVSKRMVEWERFTETMKIKLNTSITQLKTNQSKWSIMLYRWSVIFNTYYYLYFTCMNNINILFASVTSALCRWKNDFKCYVSSNKKFSRRGSLNMS